MNLTEEQQHIKDEAAGLQPGENLKVLAFAGAGKTTTLKAVAQARSDRGLYLAFNKAIADEARIKLGPTRCNATTMHALAFRAAKDMEMISRLENISAKTFMASGLKTRFDVPGIKNFGDYSVSAAVCRTISEFCASSDAKISIEHARAALMSSTGDPDFFESRDLKEKIRDILDQLSQPVFEMAQAYLRKLVREKTMSHDIYLKLLDLSPSMLKKAFLGYRYLMVDEAQDLNPVQRSILLKAGIPLIAVGDSYQQIYAWRGAEDALKLLPGKELYLTQSFRFGEKIAEQARTILNTHPEGVPKQRLVGAGGDFDLSRYSGPDLAIICRTNMGMIDVALGAMRRSLNFHIDNISSLITDVTSAQALYHGRRKDITSPDIRQYQNWGDLVLEAEAGNSAAAKLEMIVREKQVEEILRIGRQSCMDITKSDLTICTAHRSKGLEFPSVTLGADWKPIETMRIAYKKSAEKSQKHRSIAIGEWNALYVAATRAITKLDGLDPIMDDRSPLQNFRDKFNSECAERSSSSDNGFEF